MKRSTIVALGAGGLAGFAAARAYRNDHKVRLSSTGKHVVILGGGFGGLSAASKLNEMAGGQLRITLVDQHNYHLFTPMLYQVATCGVVPYDVAIPLRSFTGPRGIRFRRATVQSVDFESGLLLLLLCLLTIFFLLLQGIQAIRHRKSKTEERT